MNKREIGNIGEEFVCEFLEKNSYEILKRNYTIRGGEIDIIAKKDDIVAFIEVKTRVKNSMVSGLNAITTTKKMRIIKTAQHYFFNNSIELQPRFDVALVETIKEKVVSIQYFENAYDMSDTNIIF